MATQKTTDKSISSNKELNIVDLLEYAMQGEQEKFNSFISLAVDLKGKQKELDIMATDTLPSAILTSYLSDILEPNYNGDLIQVVANTEGSQAVLDNIYERLSLPLQKIVYSLLKNGIAILKFSKTKVTSTVKSATEDIIVEAEGRILPEIDVIQDTFTVFPILDKEKCVGYIEVLNKETAFNEFNWQTDSLNYSDVIIHPPQDFTYVKFGVSRASIPLELKIKHKDGTIGAYRIDLGCSLLENSYAAWKTLMVLQDSIVLASLIKNAQFILIETEVGQGTSRNQLEAAKVQMKNLFEGKLSLGSDGIKQFLYPQSKPNFVYSFTQNGVGAIKTSTVGGEYNPGNLYYLTPFVNQFFGGMNVAKQNYGFTEGAGGLDGGGAVEVYNKRYNATVAQFKRLLGELITKTIRNILDSRQLKKLMKSFTVKVHGAFQDGETDLLSKQESHLRLLQSVTEFLQIEDPVKLSKLKMTMLKNVFTDKELLEAMQEAISPSEKEQEEMGDEGEEGFGDSIGAGFGEGMPRGNSSDNVEDYINSFNEEMGDRVEEPTDETSSEDMPNMEEVIGQREEE